MLSRFVMGFHGSSAGKESTCNAGDPSLISGLERFPGERIGYPLQYSCLENPQGQRRLAGRLWGGRPGFDPWVGKTPWRRVRQPTPVFLPGESHGQRSLVGYSPWDHKEGAWVKWLNMYTLIITSFWAVRTSLMRLASLQFTFGKVTVGQHFSHVKTQSKALIFIMFYIARALYSL